MQNYCREILLQELETRKSRNPMYTMRSFARYLKLGTTSLSDVLSNKRKLSKKNILKISDRLALSPTQQKLLLLDLSRDVLNDQELASIQLEEDTFYSISEWYYLAILNLAKLPENKADLKWISEHLLISESQVDIALCRLQRLKLLEIQDGRMTRTVQSLRTSTDVPSSAIRKYQSGLLKKISEIIEADQVPLEMRDISSVTMTVDRKNLKKAKEILMLTKKKIARLLESDHPEDVYVLSFQLIPLTSEVRK